MKRTVSVFKDRRGFIHVVFIILLGVFLTQCSTKPEPPVFVQELLPYADDALEPYMSAKTISFHYGVHYAAYVKNANMLMKELDVDEKTPEDVIVKAFEEMDDDKAYRGLYNQAAQAWNHAFFWKCMKPDGGGAPCCDMLYPLTQTFGSYEQFKESFIAAGKGLFGSGWIWLVSDEDGVLSILTTADAHTPLAHGFTPILTVDAWEHSYYLDYQNKRGEYIQAVLEHLVNWEFVASQYNTIVRPDKE